MMEFLMEDSIVRKVVFNMWNISSLTSCTKKFLESNDPSERCCVFQARNEFAPCRSEKFEDLWTPLQKQLELCKAMSVVVQVNSA